MFVSPIFRQAYKPPSERLMTKRMITMYHTSVGAVLEMQCPLARMVSADFRWFPSNRTPRHPNINKFTTKPGVSRNYCFLFNTHYCNILGHIEEWMVPSRSVRLMWVLSIWSKRCAKSGFRTFGAKVPGINSWLEVCWLICNILIFIYI